MDVVAGALAAEGDELARSMAALPYAYGGPLASGVLRAQPEDFRVDEVLKTSPSGQGGHWWLQVEKRGVNTQWVVRELARQLGVPTRDVGYGGLKDRHAVARQWLSVPDQADVGPRLQALPPAEQWRVVQFARNEKKLRHAVGGGNRFSIVVREFIAEREALAQRMACIANAGVPNYFTEQRFGRDNLGAAAAMFAGERMGHHERGLYLSAARSALFNVVLARRVQDSSWNQLLAGEAASLAGSHSFFHAPEIDMVLRERLAARDIAPSAPLWGRGMSVASANAGNLECASLEPFPCFREGLEAAGLQQERRPTILHLSDLRFDYREDLGEMHVSFVLPAGCFATAVMRELVRYRD